MPLNASGASVFKHAFSIWDPNQSQLQLSCRHPHTERLWTGVWCYFPGWANCLWGSVLPLSGCTRTLLCYTMQPRVPGKALMKSYEKLDASWLGREGWREDTERQNMGVKHKRGKEGDSMQWGTKMDGRKESKSGYVKRNPTPMEAQLLQYAALPPLLPCNMYATGASHAVWCALPIVGDCISLDESVMKIKIILM